MRKEYVLQIPAADFEATYYFSNRPTVYAAGRFPTHMHDFLEIYVLLEGDASFMVESSLYRLEPGDAVITKPNEIHNCVLNSNSVHRHLCIWVQAGSELLLQEFSQHDFGKGNLISPAPHKKERLLLLYEQLEQAGESQARRRSLYLLLEILDILAGSMKKTVATTPVPQELERILEDIQLHFLEIDGLEYFTKKFFISQSTLSRLFRTYLHVTPGQYLVAKRLAHSRMLLRQGKSVLAACMESGFTNPSNYIRLFKKHFSVTPGQYRNA